MKRAYLHGATADERPCKTIKDRVVIDDLHATIYRAMGISPKLSYEIEKRPFYVTPDGKGKPVMEFVRLISSEILPALARAALLFPAP